MDVVTSPGTGSGSLAACCQPKPEEDSARVARIESLVCEGRISEAVRICLEYGDLGALIPCLISCDQNSQIRGTLAELTSDERDTVLRAVYKGWEIPLSVRQNSQLHVWHEQIVQLEGLGSICRTIFRK